MSIISGEQLVHKVEWASDGGLTSHGDFRKCKLKSDLSTFDCYTHCVGSLSLMIWCLETNFLHQLLSHPFWCEKRTFLEEQSRGDGIVFDVFFLVVILSHRYSIFTNYFAINSTKLYHGHIHWSHVFFTKTPWKLPSFKCSMGIWWGLSSWNLPRYCVNFDDDDLYANVYVERMVGELRKTLVSSFTPIFLLDQPTKKAY